MSASITASSVPSSSRPEETRVAELNFQLPTESRKMQPPPADNQVIPDELLVSLTSTVCSRSTLGQTAHHRHCKGCGMRRPDAVWHHPLGRKKYKYFLEQPTSVTGAGRDISFLCDAMVTPKKTEPLPPVNDRSGIGDKQDLSISDSLIPEEYHIVKNKGLRSLEFYEDAFTVQLQDDEQKLRVFPSLRPTGRLEVVQLTRLMEDMLLKAGVDQQTEELTELSQMEGLLELVQVEQNIYNIVFHELIRQVSVTCAERGQLLAKLRQRYVSLLERIPRRLKGLHTEAVAQRALDRRLTEEIHRIKASIQQLSMELSRIRDHDTFVSQQAENAHQQLAGAIEETHSNADVVQGYHELYELQKGRLEAQLLQMRDDRDYWSQITFCLALKVINVKKLQLISRLHVCEQSWSKTAEHCSLYVSSKDTVDLNTIVELSEYWREQLTAFLSQLKNTEHALCEHISAIQQGITTWLAFCNTQSQSPDPTCEKASLKKMCVDMKQWLNTLALQCERYQCEKLLCRQQALGDLQERWLTMSIELYRKHPSPDGEPPAGQLAVSELDQVLSELFKQLDRTVNGESGIQGQILSLLNLMESWVSKLSTVIKRPEPLSTSVWLKLEKALHKWQSLAQEAFQSVSRIHTEDNKDKNMPDFYTESAKVSDKVHEFITSLSNFTDIEKHKLSEEVSCIHMALTRWMLDLLILMVPDHSEDQNQDEEDKNQEEEHNYIINISPQTLEADAKTLAERLHCFSNYITRSFKLIQEELILQNPLEVESEIEMDECKKLQMESIDWMDTCTILLTGVKGCAAELPVTQSEPTSVKIDETITSDTPVSSADSMETLVLEKVSADPTAHSEVKDETEAEQRECTTEGLESQEQEDCQQGELTVCENPVVKLIDYEGHITQRTLGESSVHLNGTEELVLSPETDEAEKAFSDLTTVGILQKELHDSELRVQSAVQRALVAEEDLQAALQKIRDLESQL